MKHAFVLLVIWTAGALYAWHYLHREWIPSDEGVLAHSAERVLQGELPHRDFDEIYTGGLSFWNALAFEVFGTDLRAIRLALFIVFLAWMPAVYYLASRFASPWMAGLLTLLAVGWSIPNNPASMPSWYNLFFAVFCGAALLRFVETRRLGWLVAAGAAAGMSILFKIVGLYLVGAAILSLVYLEQTESSQEASNGARAYSILLTASAIGLVAILVLLVRPMPGSAPVLHFVFVLPGAALAVFLIREEWRHPRPDLIARTKRLGAYLAPFGAGILLVLIPFLVPYLISDSTGSLARGLFVLPLRRFDGEAVMRSLPTYRRLLVILPIAAGFWIWMRSPSRWRAVLIMVAVAIGGGFLLFGHQLRVDHAIWGSMRALVPAIVLWGLFLLVRASMPADRRAMIVIVIALVALCALIQIPFATNGYFLYVAPLVALAALAVASLRPAAMPLFAVLALFYLLHAAVWIAPAQTLREPHTGDPRMRRLGLERGGLWVPLEDAQTYEELVRVLRNKAGNGYVYATPDIPEVYFLSGLRNPGRTIMDFFDDPEDRTERVLSMLEHADVHAVVIKSGLHSGPVPSDLLRRLTDLYPNSHTVGEFTVRWRK